ncbi:hypothetical protein [Streptomyces sp. NPDC046197]|uniref:DUF6891 domain-containing protein n=1 Tax=Streptomyces sp. NPDC046197 TaxID=3154337 RepID=UPI0033DDDD2B
MEIDEVLAVKVETENGQTHTRISVPGLRELVERTGSAGDRFLVAQRTPDIPDAFAQREGARGFVFFRQQVTEQAADGHGLSLYYGGFDGSAETTTTVGHEVVAALTGAGLSAMWDGNPDKAIEVTSLTWHKRLVG